MNKKSFEIAAVYAGTVLGAGFVSGKEILQFFVGFGFKGLLGMILSGFIFSIIAIRVFTFMIENNINSYNQFSEAVFGEKFGKCFEILSVTFLMVLFSAMFSGAAETLYQAFNINKVISVFIMSLFCFIIFLNGVDAMIKVNAFICPILIVGTMVTGIYIFFYDSLTTSNINNNNIFKGWLISAILYCSYNSITAIAVLCGIREVINTKREAIWGSILGGGSMVLIALFIALPLYAFFDTIDNASLPILTLIQNKSSIINFIYIVILLLAIFTTAIGNGFAIIKYCEITFKSKSVFIKLFVIVISSAISSIGFENFISSVYPVFGYIGLFQLIIMFFLCK